MSVADQIREHGAGRAAPLISLRMLAQGEAGAPLPRRVVVEVAQATGTVLAEAEAAGRAALAAVAGGGHPGDGTFLRVRLDRLAAAADARDHRGPRGGFRRDAPASAQVRRADLGHLDGAGRRVRVTAGQRRVIDDTVPLQAPERDESPITHSPVASPRLT